MSVILKLNSIVDDPTKFKEIDYNLDSNALEDCKSVSLIKKPIVSTLERPSASIDAFEVFNFLYLHQI